MKLKTVAAGLVGLLVLIIGGFSLWFFVLREDGPEEVSTASALEALDRAATSPAATSPAAGASATPAGSAVAAAPSQGEGLDGTWNVDTTLGSFVGYRVQEELAGLGGVVAVGRTAGVTGSITVAGNQATAGAITADMTALKSQEAMRDGQLRNQGIEYGKYPTSEFKLTAPVAVPADVTSGQTAKVTIAGELTLHGVKKAVQVPAEVTFKDGTLVVVGSLEVKFADYGIAKPQSQRVVGMEDHGVMEMQLFFKRG